MSSSLSSSRSISISLPGTTSDRLRAAAAARGVSIQGLIGGLIERFLAEEGRKPPDLANVAAVLRGHTETLKQRGIARLWVFGSVARGDAGPNSDIDLAADFDPMIHMTLVRLASFRAELSNILGAPADLVERATLRPAVREAVEREAVQVL